MSEVQIPLNDTVPPPTTPRPFLEVTDLWLKVHKMTEVFFAREAGRASASTTFLSILVLSIATAVLSLLASAVQGGFDASWLPAEYREVSSTILTGSLGCRLFQAFFTTLIGFYLNNTLVYVGARIFGGRGDLKTQAYLQSLFVVPIGIVSALAALVPLVGCLIPLALAIVSLILSVRSVKAAHDVTTGPAIGAVLTPLLIAAVFACLGIVALTLIGASLIDVLEQVGLGA